MFSGAVKLLDLNDYIRPGEECVVLKPAAGGKVELLFDASAARADLIRLRSEKATLSLSDCLACAGCVTTSEALLVEEQSVAALLRDHGAFAVKVALVSAQSLASLAVAWRLSMEESLAALTAYFRGQLGFEAVFDTQAFAHLVNLRALAEFQAREAEPPRTLLCSECPGWVCYLEKVLGEAVVPFASTQKPPQLLQAEALRGHLARLRGCAREEVYVVLVAPCFDKKLEAAREEGRAGAAVINLVISTEEARGAVEPLLPVDCSALEVLDSYELCRALLAGAPWQPRPLAQLTLRRSYRDHGSSNGYLDFILRHAFPADAQITFAQRKNRNFVEARVAEGSRETFFALVYGFKNIQNLVRELKAGRTRYRYVEVMACPGGCAGGGGQVPLQAAEAVLAKMDAMPFAEREQALLVEELARQGGFVPEDFHHYAIAALPRTDSVAFSW